MEYKESLEPLTEKERVVQRKNFLIVLVFYLLFTTIFVFIISSVLETSGGDFFFFVVITFIGCVALFIFLLLILEFLKKEKLVVRGIITDKSVRKNNSNNTKEFVLSFHSYDIPVQANDFTQFTIGDTVEVSRSAILKNIIGIKRIENSTNFKRTVTEENSSGKLEFHRDALQFDHDETIDKSELLFLGKLLLKRVVITLLGLVTIWMLSSFIHLFVSKVNVTKWISISVFELRLLCVLLLALPFIRRILHLLQDLSKCEKEITYRKIISIKTHGNVLEQIRNKTTVILDDETRVSVPLTNDTAFHINELLELHKAKHSQIILHYKQWNTYAQ